MNRFIAVLTLFITFFAFHACEELNTETNISKFGEDESHYTGDNCMNCHYSVGMGEGSFSVAGSVFGNTNQAVVQLTNGSTGQILGSVEVDQLGNFYTTENIDFSNGILVDILYGNGEVKSMDRTIYTGACNLCHDPACASTLDQPCDDRIEL